MDQAPQPVGRRWTTVITACGRRDCPQGVEIVRPQFHKWLTSADRLASGPPVDGVRITSRSPACGRQIGGGPVENDVTGAAIRTFHARRLAPLPFHRGPFETSRTATHRLVRRRSRREGHPRSVRAAAETGGPERLRKAEEGPEGDGRDSAGDGSGRPREPPGAPLGSRGPLSPSKPLHRSPPEPIGALRALAPTRTADPRPAFDGPALAPSRPRRPAGASGRSAPGQPFLMRFVSSVTWL